VVQEDTREVGPVAPVDPREGLVQTLHQHELTHHLGRFPNLYIHNSRQDIGTAFGTARAGRRAVGSGAGGATGSIRGV
jgi:hypothetical protein